MALKLEQLRIKGVNYSFFCFLFDDTNLITRIVILNSHTTIVKKYACFEKNIIVSSLF